MKSNRFWDAAVLSLLSIASVIAGCQTAPPDYGAQESQLAAAGFLMKPANTPERQAMLGRLPAHEFLIRQNNGTTHYVYADPLVCDCLYVGTQQAFDQYRANQQAQNFIDARQLAALSYSDAAWSWGAWGPWEPVGVPFGFVYGPVGW
jgi:hypothetical protein